MTRIRLWGAGVALGATAALCLLGSADASTQSITCGQSVTSNVTLTANLNCTGFSGPGSILTVTASNITINLNGHSILGPSSSYDNITAVDDEVGGMTLTNGKIVDTGHGIVLDGVSGSTVSKISFNLGGSRNYTGVEADSGDHNTFTQLTGTNLKRLVRLGFETSDTISSNVSHGAEDAFYDLGGTSDTFSGNKAYADTDVSFTCNTCSGDTFTGNYSESSLDSAGFTDAFPAGSETYNGNTVAVSGGDGFDFNYPGYIPSSGQPYTVTNNVVEEATFDGIFLVRGYFDNGGDPSTFPGSTVSGNVVAGAQDSGISVFGPLNTTITGNTASNNGGDGFGFIAEGVPTMTLTGNTANSNQGDGFRIEQDSDGPEPTFNHNTAIGNGSYAFALTMNASGTTPWLGDHLVGRNSGAAQDCSNVTCSSPTSVNGIPAIGGSTIEGQLLSGTKGAWGISTIGQSFSYVWLRCDSGGSNCTPTSTTGGKYKLLHSDIGSTFEFQVTATDDNGQTVATSAPSALITGLPPTNKTLPVINVVSPQKTLSGTNGTWSATDTITYAKQWLRCDSSGDSCSVIGGATGSQYSIVGADVGGTIRLQVTATANAAPAVATSNPTAVIIGISPSYTAVPGISPGSPAEGRSITSTTGTWTGTQPITFSRQWMRCDSGGANCVNIAGATGASYTTTMDDVGSTILVHFTATNATASFGIDIGPTYPVQVYGPSTSGHPTISGTLRDGATLTAHTGAWNGGSPATSITYQWFRCDPAGDLGSCTPIASPSSTATYVLTPSDTGQTIVVNVEESNSGGSNQAASTPALIAGNPPVNTVLPSIGGDLSNVGNPLTGSRGTWTGRGPITYSYVWLTCDFNGDNCTPATSPSSTPGTFPLPPVGTVRFQVTASNVDGSVIAVSDPVNFGV